MINMKTNVNQRGFVENQMEDVNGRKISLRESSAADEARVWLGVISDKIVVFEDENKGKYITTKIPDNVMLDADMHINREMAKEIADRLMYFHTHGELPLD